jgi:uncharacterized metal-binding protein YceD (DUF177 family)
MPLTVNLRHLEAHNLELKGELPVQDLELDLRDEVVHVEKPLTYELEIQRLDNALLVRGRLLLPLHCRCVRCLKHFVHPLKLDSWTRHLPLEGDESVAIVNDCVDLTPCLREDILLEFPQHPLCEAGCRGMPKEYRGIADQAGGESQTKQQSSAWSQLDKLKF